VNVAAIDPSQAFVQAARERNPEVDVRHAPAEKIPSPTTRSTSRLPSS